MKTLCLFLSMISVAIIDHTCSPVAPGNVTPGGMVRTDYSWSNVPSNGTETGFFNLDLIFSPERDPGEQTKYYWAHQFWFHHGDGGYMGLQTDGLIQGKWSGKIAIFSIWKANGAQPGPGASAERFGGEGTGWSCRIKYPWIQGHEYRFRIWAVGKEPNGEEWWGAWIKDMNTGAETYIGKIRVPASWSWLKSQSVAFTEYFGNIRSCGDTPYAKARLEGASADDNRHRPATTRSSTYGTCKANAKAWDDGALSWHETGTR